ncbi:hypothetical protein [Xanthocytophaga agilis]|uniref:Uncharacterized protein n=1 Tax=Xanthocytophaga agilis TaxID=3048010 RepID=A0AAE3R087_9BACT|nr:hypothetical protein [Xanthocytophaga agilis]MDJ1499227.1 hypothetical protein [Xanthocytophaga agilis]
MYKTSTEANVIVGSSLSAKLLMDSLSHFDNLSFSGLSIFDGLNLILEKGNLPKTVFIETNLVLRPENTQFKEDLFSPIPFYTKKLIPAFRDGQQPMAVFGHYLEKNVTQNILTKFESIKNSTDKPLVSALSPALFEKMLSNEIQNYSVIPQEKLIQERFEKLNTIINYLNSKKVDIVFFEMPIHERLCHSPVSNVVRSSFYQYFSKKKYYYITQPSCADYQTTDGLHFNSADALRYTSYFKSQVQKYLSR